MDPPDSFICPITQDIMKDPVIDKYGHTYEKNAIEQWIQTNNTSPITRQPLNLADIIPNRSLKQSIEAWGKNLRERDTLKRLENKIDYLHFKNESLIKENQTVFDSFKEENQQDLILLQSSFLREIEQIKTWGEDSAIPESQRLDRVASPAPAPIEPVAAASPAPYRTGAAAQGSFRGRPATEHQHQQLPPVDDITQVLAESRAARARQDGLIMTDYEGGFTYNDWLKTHPKPVNDGTLDIGGYELLLRHWQKIAGNAAAKFYPFAGDPADLIVGYGANGEPLTAAEAPDLPVPFVGGSFTVGPASEKFKALEQQVKTINDILMNKGIINNEELEGGKNKKQSKKKKPRKRNHSKKKRKHSKKKKYSKRR